MSHRSPLPIRLYNTETRQKQPLQPIQPGLVTLYTCGPTVYNFVHIGNLRTFMFEDLLRRTLKFLGYQVNHVMNLTDVDDKTIRGAITQGITLDEFTQPYKEAFFEDLKTLHIESAEHYPAATQYIAQMITMIQKLLDVGVAYKGGDGSIYFAINRFPRYGCLSHLKLDELKAGASARVMSDEYEKDHVADFVLWKHYESDRDGQIFWESPFGPGRPGWHLECSAMATSLLGHTVDIHVGGIDNMFPHHENEIAQSEACFGSRFVNLWMHAEHLVVDGKKMSKSLGNFYTLRDLLKMGYTGIQIRYLLLQTHYKTQLNFTLNGLEAAQHSIQRLQEFILRLQHIQQQGPQISSSSASVTAHIEQTLTHFTQALADDLNISAALAALFDYVREINLLCDHAAVSRHEASQLLALLEQMNQVLGICSFEQAEEEVPKHLIEALEKRVQARIDKNWALADQLRDLIVTNGYQIEDTPYGARLKRLETTHEPQRPH